MRITFRTFIYMLISGFLFFSCQKKAEVTTNQADGLLSEEQMVAIIVDLHIVDAKTKQLKKQYGPKTPPVETLNDRIFKAYQIDRKQFEQSLAYYSKQPEQLEGIYDKVIAKLEERKITIEKTQPKQEPANSGNQ